MSPISRRRFLKRACLNTMVIGAACDNVLAQVPSESAATITMAQWMDSLIFDVKEKGAGQPLKFGRFADPFYYLTGTIDWLPDPGQHFQAVTVPKGFVTDLASIPRIFWSALRPDGLYAYAAIIHDYLYWTQTRSREEADEILKMSMQDFKVPSLQVEAIHLAVRKFGGSAWAANTELRKKGEQRELKTFPDKATVTWNEWKKIPGAF